MDLYLNKQAAHTLNALNVNNIYGSLRRTCTKHDLIFDIVIGLSGKQVMNIGSRVEYWKMFKNRGAVATVRLLGELLFMIALDLRECFG
jgi:hypothetical protein